MNRFMKKSVEKVVKFRHHALFFTVRKCFILTCFFFSFSDMDGLGSPDSMMDHSMLDLKNSSPYACYSSPKLSYDAFQHNRGKNHYFDN